MVTVGSALRSIFSFALDAIFLCSALTGVVLRHYPIPSFYFGEELLASIVAICYGNTLQINDEYLEFGCRFDDLPLKLWRETLDSAGDSTFF
jgi:hypothetical protein